jgi:phage FluMu gp28-like protein
MLDVGIWNFPAPLQPNRKSKIKNQKSNMFSLLSPLRHFLLYQRRWITDNSPLKLIQKSRQIGISYADAYHSVRIASQKGARLDVFISSRDTFQARLYIEDCKHWAEILHEAFQDLGEIMLDPDRKSSAYVIQFANGRRIYSLSSNPNALAGKRGHVKLDEFALHADQRLLYRIAKPITTWGGTLSIISTHRGVGSVFNQLVREACEDGNRMGWSLHSVPVQEAVKQGLVEKINGKTNGKESREEFLDRLRAECIDEEQWLQEYCCKPADESSAFFTYEMLNACEERGLELMSFEELAAYLNTPDDDRSVRPTLHASSLSRSANLYLGMDVARKQHLCVIDVGEKIGDVMWDRVRIEIHNKPFGEIESELYRLLELPQVKRACIDESGNGIHLAERAKERFRYKVEPVNFTATMKEELAFGLRRDFEERKLRLVPDDKLRNDLRGLKKEVTPSGNIRFIGETEDSHCDRTWAKALRQHAARYRKTIGARVG